MFSFFMWGGFVFSLVWHLSSLRIMFVAIIDLADGVNHAADSIMINIGLSGISLCYFGMLAFK